MLIEGIAGLNIQGNYQSTKHIDYYDKKMHQRLNNSSEEG
jgi:hypothetical protein